MKKENRELARQSFVLASSLLEEGHGIAIAGQAEKLQAKTCADYAVQLNKLSHEIQTIADFLALLANR